MSGPGAATARSRSAPPAGDAATVRLSGGRPLHGRRRVPGDKSISHRALILGALAEGESRLRGLSDGDDVARTRTALQALGAEIDGEVVRGGRARFREPERPIDVGNSGTGLRLLTGLVAAFPFLTVLIGDQSIHRRPMDRVAEPLRAMGASIDGRDGGRLAPIVVRGGGLVGVDWSPALPSAQVKGAILLAALGADGETVVRERVATRRHTEELLALAGAPVRAEQSPQGYAVHLGAAELSPFELDVPGDPSQAAFLVVAACIVPGSEVTVEDVYVGPGRAGFLGVLERMGADLSVERRDATTADVTARYGPLRATVVEGAEIPDCIDEIPVLAIAAAAAEGTTEFRDAAELRVKESDRIATTSAGLQALGVAVDTSPAGLAVHGSAPGAWRGGRVASHGDHRIAMAFAVAALAGGGELLVDGFDAVATSWPGFLADLEALR